MTSRMQDPTQRGPGGGRSATRQTGKAGPRGPRGKTGPAGPSSITREEFDAAVNSIHDNLQELRVQFRRMAQMQAELDELKRTVARLSGHRENS
jgi:hypothetical protein